MSLQTKDEIVSNWLPRYTGTGLDEFGEYILLTNFSNYVEKFALHNNCEVKGIGYPMQTATSEKGITIINFGIGAANAATIMDLLTAVRPKACLFLGKCGGLKGKVSVGDLILPLAAIRGDGVSDDYFPKEVPALPSFQLQKAVSHIIVNHNRDYFSGTIYSTNRRVWEHDKEFKAYLKKIRSIGIDIETATVFTVGFANHIPKGALLLVSDVPMTPEGVKTDRSDELVTRDHVDLHLQIGIESLRELKASEKQILQDLVDELHLQFVSDTAKARGMEIKTMANLADGRAYTGQKALQLKLIDRLGNLDDAVQWAGELAQIKGDLNPVYPREDKLTFIKRLADTLLKDINITGTVTDNLRYIIN